MLLLDSACGMLLFIEAQSAIDRIRWWTCWCSIAGSRRGFLKVPVRDWLDAGRATWSWPRSRGPNASEHHCQPGGEYWLGVVVACTSSGCRRRHNENAAKIIWRTTWPARTSNAGLPDVRPTSCAAVDRRRSLSWRTDACADDVRGTVSIVSGVNWQRGRILPRWPVHLNYILPWFGEQCAGVCSRYHCSTASLVLPLARRFVASLTILSARSLPGTPSCLHLRRT